MIPVAQPTIQEKEKQYVTKAVESTWVSSAGEYITQFEQNLSQYLEIPYVSTTSNGTTALHLALLALHIGPGDEVILPASSFIATLNAILYVGATPVFVDVELESWGIDATKIEEKITKKTKAIVVVHLYGYACDILSVMDVATKHHIKVIEDNAESIGASAHGKKLGTIGHIGTLSFFGNKIITTGEGGAVMTNDQELFEQVELYKNQGRRSNANYDHEVLGYNYRMTNMQAALGCAQLEQIDIFLAERKKIEDIYRKELEGVVTPQTEVSGTQHVNWFFSCLFHESINIETLKQSLKEDGIDTRRIFSPMNTMPYVHLVDKDTVYMGAQTLYERGLSLPTFVGLTQDQVRFVCERVRHHLS